VLTEEVTNTNCRVSGFTQPVIEQTIYHTRGEHANHCTTDAVHGRMIGFTSTYGSCHGHDCMIVGFTSTYGSCHGHDCLIVRFTISYDGCHGHDCMLIGSTSRYVGYRGHDYKGNLIVLYNIFVVFFLKHCDALVYVIRLHFLSLNTENAWLL
jgi:hypothetical protein